MYLTPFMSQSRFNWVRRHAYLVQVKFKITPKGVVFDALIQLEFIPVGQVMYGDFVSDSERSSRKALCLTDL
jgi:hypothetical protein